MMTWNILLALVLTGPSSSLFAGDPAVTTGMSNGRAWNGMPVATRFVYLVGLYDGVRQAQVEIVPVLFSKPTTGQEEKAAEIIPSVLPIGKGFPDMIAALDRFYTDAQNLDIPVPVAARHEKAMLEGRDRKQLAESLRRLRVLYKMSKDLDALQDKK